MAKTQRTPLEKIMTLNSSKVAKLFFRTYLTPSIVTQLMYPKAYKQTKENNKPAFVVGYIRDCLNEWKKLGFIEKSPIKLPFKVEKKSGNSYILKNYGYRLTLEPLYLFCKEKHNIEFTKQEKEIINKRVGIEVMRKRIFLEYPNDDIINATLKFYIKQFAIPPLEILNKDDRRALEIAIQSNDEEKEIMKKGLKIDKNKPSKKEPSIIIEREIENTCLKSLCNTVVDKKTGKLNISINDLKLLNGLMKLKLYVASYNKNPELITSINKKFKIALGIF